jgi:hypothetical protein
MNLLTTIIFIATYLGVQFLHANQIDRFEAVAVGSNKIEAGVNA